MPWLGLKCVKFAFHHFGQIQPPSMGFGLAQSCHLFLTYSKLLVTGFGKWSTQFWGIFKLVWDRTGHWTTRIDDTRLGDEDWGAKNVLNWISLWHLTSHTCNISKEFGIKTRPQSHKMYFMTFNSICNILNKMANHWEK